MSMKKIFIGALLIPITAASLAFYSVNAQDSEDEIVLTEKQQSKFDKALAGRTAGPAQNCISRSEQRHFTAISDDIFIFKASRNNEVVYVNQPKNGCRGAQRNALVYQRPNTILCSGDIVRVEDLLSNTPVSSCAFGKFIPYTKNK